jgi:hypothetical protein
MGIHSNLLNTRQSQKTPIQFRRWREWRQKTPHVLRHLITVEIGKTSAGNRSPKSLAYVGIRDQGNAGFSNSGNLVQTQAQLECGHHPCRFIPKDDRIKVP